MKKDEKSCPKCAETIKLAALRCKHCGVEFSTEEVERHVSEKKARDQQRTQSRKAKKIDEVLDCFPLWDDSEIRPHEVKEIAYEAGVTEADVLQRATYHGMTFVDKPPVLGPDEWPQEMSNTIDKELREAAVEGILPFDRWIEIEARHNIRSSADRIHQLGLAYVDATGAVVDEVTLRKRRGVAAASDHLDESKSWPAKLTSFTLLLLAVGLLAHCVIGRSDETPSAQNPAYANCEAQLKPKLNRCLQGPQSTWEACGEAYLSEMKSCTGH